MLRLILLSFIFALNFANCFARDSNDEDCAGPSGRDYIQPCDYGPNSHRAFLQSVCDVDFPDKVRIDLSGINFVDVNDNITHTIDFNSEFRVGDRASLVVRLTWEDWEMNEEDAEAIGCNTEGSNFGDIDFIGRYNFIDKEIRDRDFKLGAYLILKTTSGDDIDKRFTDTMGGGGVLFLTRELVKRDKVNISLHLNGGFGGLDAHLKSSDMIGGETTQNDLWLYQAKLIISDKDLLKKVDLKLAAGVVGFKGWFGEESGDNITNCDFQLSASKAYSNLEMFVRYGDDLRGHNPKFFGCGLRWDLKKKKQRD